MFTIAVLVAIGTAWFVTNSKYETTKLWKYRRMRAAFSWAFVGAIVGSYFGVAGMGTAIAGTPIGAVISYLCASNLMKKDSSPLEAEKTYSEVPLPKVQAPPKISNEILEKAQAPKKITVKSENNWSWESIVSYALIIAIAGWYVTEKFNININPFHYLSQSTKRNIEPAPQAQSKFEILREKYEIQYPQINPYSPQFDQALTNSIAERIKILRNAGHSSDQALEIAISEKFKAPEIQTSTPPPQAYNNTATVQKIDLSECEYKAIMTNEDYLACGIQPPSR